ncbi:MAG: tetratricopeptide repeat protein [bacterium]
MSKNKLIQYIVLILVIIIIGGYFVWQGKFKQEPNNQSNSTNQSLGVERFFEFKVLDQTLSTELKNKYYGDFSQMKAVLEKDNKNTDALKEIAKIKTYIGDYEGAREIYLYAEAISPLNYTIPASLADLCHNFIKDYTCAEDAYKRAIDKCVGKTETDCSLIYMNLYDLYYNIRHDNALAENILKEGLVKLPDNVNLPTSLANHYKKIGDNAKAKEIYEKILKLDPKDENIKAVQEAVRREMENLPK